MSLPPCPRCACPATRPQWTVGSCDGTLHRLDSCGHPCHSLAQEVLEAAEAWQDDGLNLNDSERALSRALAALRASLKEPSDG